MSDPCYQVSTFQRLLSRDRDRRQWTWLDFGDLWPRAPAGYISSSPCKLTACPPHRGGVLHPSGVWPLGTGQPWRHECTCEFCLSPVLRHLSSVTRVSHLPKLANNKLISDEQRKSHPTVIPTIAASRVYNGPLFASYSRGDDPRLHGISGFMASDWHPTLSKDSWQFGEPPT